MSRTYATSGKFYIISTVSIKDIQSHLLIRWLLFMGGNMREITKLMIREYNIKKLGFDFMGYALQKNDIYTFHHLIVPNRAGGKQERWNGAILCGKTSHPYLHVIENKDFDMFCYLTSEMIDMNIKGYLDIYNLRNIGNLLKQFEKEHSGDRTSKGKILIKEEYTKRVKL